MDRWRMEVGRGCQGGVIFVTSEGGCLAWGRARAFFCRLSVFSPIDRGRVSAVAASSSKRARDLNFFYPRYGGHPRPLSHPPRCHGEKGGNRKTGKKCRRQLDRPRRRVSGPRKVEKWRLCCVYGVDGLSLPTHGNPGGVWGSGHSLHVHDLVYTVPGQLAAGRDGSHPLRHLATRAPDEAFSHHSSVRASHNSGRGKVFIASPTAFLIARHRAA